MKRIIALLMLLALASALAFPPTPAYADGIIIPEPPICFNCPVPPPPPREVPYLTVQNHFVNVTIEGQVATTRIDQTFRNDSQWSLEGTYIFPLPENAAISDFAMWIDGDRVEGQLYTKEEARRIYDNIVRRRLDPALLEYVGRDLFQASIFPIDSGDTRRVQIEYTELLPIDNGLVQYVYPLSTERFSAKPLENVAVTVEIRSDDAIKAIYSPSHPVSIDRDGNFRAQVGWESFEVKPTTDFTLYYTVSPQDVGLNLLSFKARDEDGFFVLLLAPNVETGQVIEKDVTLVLDTSGSMEGEKMQQARDALKFVLDHLNAGDRFNIVAFSTGVRTFSTKPEPLSALPEARRFVDNLEPGGSTDINRALLEAISAADRQRPTIVIFLTDGLPTSGVVETPLILNNVDQAATSNLRIFPFGVGDDVDTVLLDTLSQEQRGASAYVRPGERVDEQVSAFYAKVSTPVLADISLEVNGVQIEDSYPFPLPDLFAGTQLILAGRYRQGGPATLTLRGEVNGQTRIFDYDNLSFAASSSFFPEGRQNQADFIPRLWATRKIGHLLNQIRLHGEDRELIDEVVNLSVRYGIITPYTSFLVEEPELALSQEGRAVIAAEEFAEAEAAPAAEVSGERAVSKAVGQNALAEADMAAPPPAATALPVDQGADSQPDSFPGMVTAVGEKAFVFRDGIWTDTTFEPSTMTTTSLPFPSDKFFEFLGSQPQAGQYFALGSQVIVVIDGVAYETVVGEVDQIPDRIELDQAPAEVEPSANGSAPVTAQPAAEAGEIHTTLTASVIEGAAPLEVTFAGELVGGADDNQDFYCVESTFDFGDGVTQSAIPGCIEWQPGVEVQRRYAASYIYEKPGTYQVVFQLGQAASEPITILVRDQAAASAEARDEPNLDAENEAVTEPEITQSATDDEAPEPVQLSLRNLSCLTGLVMLAALGAVVDRRRS